MIIILQIFQQVLEDCYDQKSFLVYDENINQMVVQLTPLNVSICSNMPIGVQVNLTINSIEGSDIPIITTTISNFVYETTTNITFQTVLPPGQKITLVYSMQLDIFTFGSVLTTLIPKFLIQKSNLQECYEHKSIAQVFRNRVEITLYPTGLCSTQMALKDVSLDNYLQGVQLTLSEDLVELDLSLGFDYNVKKQQLVFNVDLLKFAQQQPFLNSLIIFSTNQSGQQVQFQVDIQKTELETVIGFFQSIQLSLQNNNIYIQVQLDQTKYDDYIKHLGDVTTFKVSFVVNGSHYSFSVNHNQPLQNLVIIKLSCDNQIIKLNSICKQIVLSQTFDLIVIDMISISLDQNLKSMYKQTPKLFPTCWTKVTGIRHKKQLKVTLQLNGKCNTGSAQFTLTNNINQQISINQDSSSTSLNFKGEDQFFDSINYTLEMRLKDIQFLIFIDDLQDQQINFTVIFASIVGVVWIVFSMIYSLYGIVNALVALKRRKRSNYKKRQ
ncbi:hypothetical protein SS50377_27932 [Spironucleus salmonicida]|uniref:Transmembrane protein n=1 Tax=Spironucleus salmonicida TaxID=348837 RepID=V6LP40_9EUKA|nr:hypothetical protein SS50377_27932 [Spironucleus salmonicida]|eukprot:EST42494.1 Hypothetical protein SS50377_17800 [Spironucleus salmonicida]